MEFPLTSLPNEVLAVIFSHLGIKDRLQASLVCKQWFHLINCRSLLNDINVRICQEETVHIFSSTNRKFINFSFFKILIDNSFSNLFKHIAPYVETITFFQCELDRKERVSFDDLSFSKLQNLIIIDCDLWCIFSELPSLIELHLTGKSTIADDGIAILEKNIKNLKILTISCDIIFDPKVYKRFYSLSITYEKNPSSAILSFPAIKSFISGIASTLTELNFSLNRLTAVALKELASIKELNLNKISLYDLSECYKSLIDLFKNQKNLKILHFECSSLLDDNTIDTLCILLPNIKELKIINCEITDYALKKIFQLYQLKEINLKRCRGLTPIGFHKAMFDFKPIKVKHLNLSGIAIPKDSAPLIKNWSYLVYLNIYLCQVIDLHIHAVSTFLIHLQYLNLGNNDITDYGITGTLVAKDVCPVSVEFLNALYNLKDLRILHLDYCSNLTDHGLISAIRFPLLKYLYMKGINVSRETISVLQSQNKNLQKIYWESY